MTRRLLFVTKRPFYPDSSGGGQHSALYLLDSLKRRGWQVEIICARNVKSPYFRQSLVSSLRHFRIPFPAAKDEDFGYPCWRVITHKRMKQLDWITFLDRRLKRYKPDIVLGHCSPMCPLLRYAAEQGYKTCYFARSVDHFEDGASLPEEIYIVANSPYTAQVISKFTNRRKIEAILPFIEKERYQIQKRERKYITFINPIPQKGVDIVLEVVRNLPEVMFLLIKGKWVLYQGHDEIFLEPFRKLPNVEIWEHQEDMRQVYSVTDVLLVPSQYNETFGRVIVEAQVNGIPVVASDVGGIPFTVGEGGVLISPKNDFRAYARALRMLKADGNFYAQMSKSALQNSKRVEFDPLHQVRKFSSLMEKYLET